MLTSLALFEVALILVLKHEPAAPAREAQEGTQTLSFPRWRCGFVKNACCGEGKSKRAQLQNWRCGLVGDGSLPSLKK